MEVTRYMVDQDRSQDGINRAMARFFGGHRPAGTSVEVVRLATDPRLVLELKAVGCCPIERIPNLSVPSDTTTV